MNDNAPAPTIEAIVFDFDGLILETETPVYESLRLIYREHGHDLPIQRWVDILGQPAHKSDLVGELEALIGRPLDRDALRTRRRAWIKERLDRQDVLPGVAALIDEAIGAGVKLAVASGSDRAWVEGHLRTHRLLEKFDAVVTAEDTDEHKPDPAPFLAACAAVGAAPTRSVALEDSPNGVRSASAAGLFTVAAPTTMTAEQPFPGAHWRVDTLHGVTLPRLAAALADHRPG